MFGRRKLHDVKIMLETNGDLWRCAIYVDGVLMKASPPAARERAEKDYETAMAIARSLTRGNSVGETSDSAH